MKGNPYYFIFYNLYKFSQTVATKNSNEKDFADSAFLSLTISFFFLALSTDLLLNLTEKLHIGRNNSFIFWGLFLIILYSLNNSLLIKNQKYLEITDFYDKKRIKNVFNVIFSLTFLLLCFISFFIIIYLK